MSELKELQEKRTKLFQNVYDGIIPERVPVEISVNWDTGVELAGLNKKKAFWDLDTYPIFFDAVCSRITADKSPINMSGHIPAPDQILESRLFVMAEDGTVQHPERSTMNADEYDEFNKDPYYFICENLLPRWFGAMEGKSAFQIAKVLTKYVLASKELSAKAGAVQGSMIEKYGYAPLSYGGGTIAPFDCLADHIRSFSEVVKDIRRVPEKVEIACEALTPMLVKKGLSPISSRYFRTFIPLHMAPYLNRKQFERFYAPSYTKLLEGLASGGAGVKMFVEADWMPHLDYLADCKDRTEMQFEFGDPKLAKEKVGKDHIISGFYPLTLLQTGTKQQCVDKAKELIDILAPGGGYIFNLDKSIFSAKGSIIDNLNAVIETVMQYGVY